MVDGYYSDCELREMGFKSLGEDVKISRLTRIFHPERMSIGNHVRIDDFGILSGYITLGNHIHFGAYVGLMGGTSEIIVGDYSGISYQSLVIGETDDYYGEYLTGATVPEKFRRVTGKRTVIGEHVIIGPHSTVLPDVIIGDGCSFGANSLINKSTEAWGLYVGCPCKRMKDRKKDLLRYVAESEK